MVTPCNAIEMVPRSCMWMARETHELLYAMPLKWYHDPACGWQGKHMVTPRDNIIALAKICTIHMPRFGIVRHEKSGWVWQRINDRKD